MSKEKRGKRRFIDKQSSYVRHELEMGTPIPTIIGVYLQGIREIGLNEGQSDEAICKAQQAIFSEINNYRRGLSSANHPESPGPHQGA